MAELASILAGLSGDPNAQRYLLNAMNQNAVAPAASSPVVSATPSAPAAPQNVYQSTAYGLPPSMNQLDMSVGTGGQPVAAGFPIFQNMIDLILRANADRRASIDQSLSIAQLFTELERISPTRAADMATRLGVTEGNVDMSFLNLFGTGTGFAQAGGPRIGGQVGNQTVSLPAALSGQEQAFLGSNPNVARIVKDVASKFGLPDIFERSAAGRIPAMSSILSGGF